MSVKDFMGWAFALASVLTLLAGLTTEAMLWLVLAELMWLHADLTRKEKP